MWLGARSCYIQISHLHSCCNQRVLWIYVKFYYSAIDLFFCRVSTGDDLETAMQSFELLDRGKAAGQDKLRIYAQVLEVVNVPANFKRAYDDKKKAETLRKIVKFRLKERKSFILDETFGASALYARVGRQIIEADKVHRKSLMANSIDEWK